VQTVRSTALEEPTNRIDVDAPALRKFTIYFHTEDDKLAVSSVYAPAGPGEAHLEVRVHWGSCRAWLLGPRRGERRHMQLQRPPPYPRHHLVFSVFICFYSQVLLQGPRLPRRDREAYGHRPIGSQAVSWDKGPCFRTIRGASPWDAAPGDAPHLYAYKEPQHLPTGIQGT
jgi:hypothetical protein